MTGKELTEADPLHK